MGKPTNCCRRVLSCPADLLILAKLSGEARPAIGRDMTKGSKRLRFIDFTGRPVGRDMDAYQIDAYAKNFRKGHKAGQADKFIGSSSLGLKNNLCPGFAHGYRQGNRAS